MRSYTGGGCFVDSATRAQVYRTADAYGGRLTEAPGSVADKILIRLCGCVGHPFV